MAHTTLTKKIGFDFAYGAPGNYNDLDDWQKSAHGYTITLRFERRKEEFAYFMGSALTDDPTLEGVMYCLVMDAQAGEMDFDEFCADFGYDQDSRKAEAIWKESQKSARKLERLFGRSYQDIIEQEWDE